MTCLVSMSDQFVKKEYDGFVAYQCSVCKEYCESTQGHVCKTENEVEHVREEMQKCLDKMYDESLQLKERTDALRRHGELEKLLYRLFIEYLNKRFSESVYRQVVYSFVMEQVDATRQMRQRVFDENDVMRQKGVPFTDRKKFLDDNEARLQWCDKEEQRLVDLSTSFVLRPYEEWVNLHDEDQMKRMGYRGFIRLFGVQLGLAIKS